MDEIRVIDGLLPADVSKQIADLEVTYKKLDEELKAVKKALLEAMTDAGIVKIDNDDLTVTLVPETTQERLDSKELKKDLPDIYNAYCKITPKAAYVKITAKE